MKTRIMSVAGTFYPDDCQEIESFIKRFDDILVHHDIKVPKQNAKALICPHAGYVYSGFTANIAYKSVVPKGIKRVVVIGPSHRVYLEGVSVAKYDVYETPCGSIMIDKDFTKKLYEEFPFVTFIDDAHHEHSTETQMPFIKQYFPDAKVVELVYGKIDFKLLSFVVEEVLNQTDTILVISTDLSHFYTIEQAKKLDNICLNAVLKKDLELFDKGCEACGIIGVKALIMIAKKLNLDIKLLDYRTSFDASGDDKRVVGYSSFIVS